MRRRTLLLGATATLLLVRFGLAPARADTLTPDAAVAFMRQTGDDLVTVVNSAEPDASKRAKLAAIIERVVDVPAVAQFCLGRFWRTATPEQRQDFTALFNQVIILSIGGRLGAYKGVSFTMGRGVPTDGAIAVRTTLNRPNNPPARVEWVVSSSSGAPRIIDVLAEGTSLRLTQRSDYGSFLANHGNSVPDLIEALRKQIAAAGSS